MKGYLTTEQAGKALNPPVSASRIRHLIAAGRIRAETFGGVFFIRESELKKIAVRKPGRPKVLS